MPYPQPTRAHRRAVTGVPVALTIAGSDSGGGAGIQADLKTFTAMRVFGTSAITCLTAQNPRRVTGIEPAPPAFVVRQIEAVAEAFPLSAAKTGMLFSSEIIRAVARCFAALPPFPLVVDPVMIATSGARLLKEDAVLALCGELFPLATVVTPNAPEAEVLCGRRIHTLADLKNAAFEISDRFGIACVAKGGHIARSVVVDVLCDNGEITLFDSPRVKARETHGTGCTFSAALAAALAKGEPLVDAVAAAKAFVTTALQRSARTGRHYPLNFLPS